VLYVPDTTSHAVDKVLGDARAVQDCQMLHELAALVQILEGDKRVLVISLKIRCKVSTFQLP